MYLHSHAHVQKIVRAEIKEQKRIKTKNEDNNYNQNWKKEIQIKNNAREPTPA